MTSCSALSPQKEGRMCIKQSIEIWRGVQLTELEISIVVEFLPILVAFAAPFECGTSQAVLQIIHYHFLNQ